MRRLFALSASALLLVGLLVGPSFAQSQEPEIVIVEVDLSRFDEDGLTTIVAEIRNIDDLDTSQIVVAEEGVVFADSEITVQTIEESSVEVGVVLAIDISGSMRGEPLEAAKASSSAPCSA